MLYVHARSPPSYQRIYVWSITHETYQPTRPRVSFAPPQYSGPIERRRAPEFAAMAESGGKDDGSDLDEDELAGNAGGGEGSTAPKGMSLKGKEEWKDVSLPGNAGGGLGNGTGLGPAGAPKQEDGAGRQVVKGVNGNGNANARARARSPVEVKGKTREMNVYSHSGPGSGSSSGSGVDAIPQQGSTMAPSTLGMAPRTVTGSWTGQGGYQNERAGYEQDDRNGGYHERVSRCCPSSR